MAEIVGGLFGVTPESLQMQRQAMLDKQAMDYASLANPYQQANYAIYRGVGGLGRELNGLLGAQDPEMAKAAALQSILKQADTTSPEGLAALAKTLGQQGFGAQAIQVMDQARQAQLQLAQVGKVSAEQRKVEMTVAQEEALRKELAALGPDATEADIMKAVTKYGSADKVLATLQSSADKAASRQQQIDLQKERIQAQIEAARERGATQLQIAQLQIEGRRQIAELTAALKQGAKGEAKLPPSLQKDEGKDLELIDSLTGQSQALAPALASLTPDAKGVRKLELGPLKNMKYEAQLAAGNSTPEARAYEALKSAVDTATNLQVSAEKGVQTDKDVLRFAKALIASYGRNDTAATYDALSRYNKAIMDAQEKAKGRLESRRKSQGVTPYYEGSTQGPKQNVIKLD